MCADPASAIAAITKAAAAVKTSLGTIGTIASIGSGVAGTVSYVQNARMAQRQGEINAKLQTEAANQALEAGQEASDRQRRAGAAAAASSKAAMAANGQDVTGADAVSLLDDARDFTAEDAFAIRENAMRQAEGFEQGAANSLTQGRIEASNARFGAVRTVLGTASKVGRRYAHLADQQGYA